MTSDTKTYQNNDIIVYWKPGICQHSANCVKGLKAVFDPSRKPWIELSEGSTPNIIHTINSCPSGALSFKYLEPTV